MAQSKTPAKRARQAENNRLRNKVYKSRLKTAIKQFDLSLKENNIEDADRQLKMVISVLDTNVSKGILHKNNAARKKSLYTRKFNAINQQ